jgi:splicing factor 3B subunit 1
MSVHACVVKLSRGQYYCRCALLTCINSFCTCLTLLPSMLLLLILYTNRRISLLLLKIKSGAPPMRKTALRQITDKAREFGAGPLFNQILPLLMSPTLEDQERHLLVKVIDRILYKLDDLVRPYVHKILVVIEPLLIDEDYYARVEGREIISNLSKAAGLATMIATMR